MAFGDRHAHEDVLEAQKAKNASSESQKVTTGGTAKRVRVLSLPKDRGFSGCVYLRSSAVSYSG